MKYLTYDEYINMGGELEPPVFERYEYAAERAIDRETFGRIKSMLVIPNAVKMLVYELIAVNAKADISQEQVKSESVGSWSKTYADTNSEDIQKLRSDMITDYLAGEADDNGTPLIYRGC